MDIHDIILASRAEQSYSTRARWALRAIRKYLRLGLAPSWRYKILHAHARAIFSTALKAAVISIYINSLYISSDTHLYIMRGRRGVNLFETEEDENV